MLGAAWRVQERREEDLSIDIVAAVREAVGPATELMIEGHSRFSVASALRIADRLAPFRPTWSEEPVPHQHIGAVVEVARRSPVPIATGESFSSTHQFAELLAHDAVHILQPEPLYLGGLWRTRQVAAIADAHYVVVAPHNAQGPVWRHVGAARGCTPTSRSWRRSRRSTPAGPGSWWTIPSRWWMARWRSPTARGWHRPRLGSVWTRTLYEPQHWLPLFGEGWSGAHRGPWTHDAVAQLGRMTPAAAPEVVTLGECLISLIARDRGPLAEAGTFLRTVAGAEANVSVGLARLGHPVAYLGRVGADAFGTVIRRQLRGEGVDVGHLTTDPSGPTGLMVRELRDLGPMEVIYHRAGSAASHLGPADVDEARGAIEGARWLHLTGITPALSASAAAAVVRAKELARGAGVRVSLDLNIRRRLWSEADAAVALRSLADGCDLVLGGLDEVALVGGLAPTLEEGAVVHPEAAADALLAAGAGRVIVKLGADGALLRDLDGTTLRSPALAVPKVVDPVGAGDAFTAATWR
ncbi:MAG: PfkB family carbohydrate kinase [Chloroflexota bacterium]